MPPTSRKDQIDFYKRWLSEENRLDRWNHVRFRAGSPTDLTLDEAAEALFRNPKIYFDLKEYLGQ